MRPAAHRPLSRLRRSAFSLIEAAIVLGVVGLVIGGIWVAASSVQDHRLVSKTLGDVLLICNRATKAFPRVLAPSGTGGTDLVAAAKAAGVFPQDWIVGNDRWVSGNRYTGIKAPIGTNDATDIFLSQASAQWWDTNLGAMVSTAGVIYMRMTSVPNRLCRQLLGYFKSSDNSQIRWVQVGDTTNYGATAVPRFTPFTMNIDSFCRSFSYLTVEFACVAG